MLKKILIAIIGVTLVSTMLYFFFYNQNSSNENVIEEEETIEEAQWQINTDETTDSIIRKRVNALEKKEDFSKKIGIAYYYDDVSLSVNYDVEDFIIDIIETDNQGILATIFTWQDTAVKEYLIYAKSSLYVQEIVDELKAQFKNIDFTYYEDEEPGWDTFDEF